MFIGSLACPTKGYDDHILSPSHTIDVTEEFKKIWDKWFVFLFTNNKADGFGRRFALETFAGSPDATDDFLELVKLSGNIRIEQLLIQQREGRIVSWEDTILQNFSASRAGHCLPSTSRVQSLSTSYRRCII